MQPLLFGAALAVVAIAAYAILTRALTGPAPRPVRAQRPVRPLRRDPATGEYRPH